MEDKADFRAISLEVNFNIFCTRNVAKTTAFTLQNQRTLVKMKV